MVTGFLFCLETRNELLNYTVYYQVKLRVSDIEFEKLFQPVSFLVAHKKFVISQRKGVRLSAKIYTLRVVTWAVGQRPINMTSEPETFVQLTIYIIVIII